MVSTEHSPSLYAVLFYLFQRQDEAIIEHLETSLEESQTELSQAIAKISYLESQLQGEYRTISISIDIDATLLASAKHKQESADEKHLRYIEEELVKLQDRECELMKQLNNRSRNDLDVGEYSPHLKKTNPLLNGLKSNLPVIWR